MANRAGLLVGSPEYMSPEQSSGRNVDIRSDIYSLGCVFYECLCDHPPYSGDPSTLLHKHAMETPGGQTIHADLKSWESKRSAWLCSPRIPSIAIRIQRRC